MLRVLLEWRARVLLIVATLLCSVTAHAQSDTCTPVPPQQGVLLNEVHTIADSSQGEGVPVECTFDVAVKGTYNVKLTDLGVTPLQSVQLGITTGTTVVDASLKAAGTVSIAADVGTYVIRVVGKPSNQLGSGPIGISVTNAADNSVLATFSSQLALPAQSLQSNEGVLDDTFTAPSDGAYVVTLADLQLPRALQTLTLIVTTQDGTIVTNPFLSAPGSVNVTLTQGTTYRIFAAGLATSTANAGLFSATVTPAAAGSTPVYSKTIPIGGVTPIGSASLTAGGSYTIKLTDLALPAALSSVEAVAVVGGQAVAQLAAAGTSTPFTSITGMYQVFAVATPGTTATPPATAPPTSGIYAISLDLAGGSSVVSAARAVTVPGGSGPTVYNYDATVASAGSYTLDLTDFAFPRSFVSLEAVVVQAGAVLGTPMTTPGKQSITAAAGPIAVLVLAQADQGGSLFGADLTAGAGATPLFATTQGVGQLFVPRQIPIVSEGNYAINVTDVGFPAPLASLAVVVTSGSTSVVSFFGTGAYNFHAKPGNYFVNFLAKPDSTALAGTYALSVAAGPSATLTSSATSVGSGGTVHLTWTSQNATGCTASGGNWSGSLHPNGDADSPPVTATTTFTVTCAGENTNDAASVTVNVTAPPASSGGKGGGGALDFAVLAVLCGLLLGRSYIRHAH